MQTATISPNKRTDQELISCIIADDPASCSELFERYYSPLVRYATRALHCQSVAEEVVQDVFCDLWQRRKSLNAQMQVRPYLYQAVKYGLLDLIRQQIRLVRYQSEAIYYQDMHYAAVTNYLLDQEYQHLLNQAIEALPEQRRRIFQLSRQENLTHQEIAQQLGISSNTVKEQISRALKFLRKQLKHEIVIIFFWLITHLTA